MINAGLQSCYFAHEVSFPGSPDRVVMAELYKRSPNRVKFALMITCRAYREVACQHAAQYEYLEDAAQCNDEASISIMLEGEKPNRDKARKMVRQGTSVAFIRAFCGKCSSYIADSELTQRYYFYLTANGEEWIDELIKERLLKSHEFYKRAARGIPSTMQCLAVFDSTASVIAIFNGHIDRISIAIDNLVSLITSYANLFPTETYDSIMCAIRCSQDTPTSDYYRSFSNESINRLSPADAAQLATIPEIFCVSKYGRRVTTDRAYCIKNDEVYAIIKAAGGSVYDTHEENCTLTELLEKYRFGRNPQVIKNTIASYFVQIPAFNHGEMFSDIPKKIADIILPFLESKGYCADLMYGCTYRISVV